MSKTHLSILTEDSWLQEKLQSTFQNTKYASGFTGPTESDLLDFLESKPMADHILFVRPTSNYAFAFNESYLRSLYKIDVIIIGIPLVDEHVALIHRSHVSGYITPQEISAEAVQQMVVDIHQKGYYANDQIPEVYWVNYPKTIQGVVAPTFTTREKQILHYLCHGFTQVETAQILRCSTSNVQNHMDRIKSKTLVQTTVELVAISITNQWVNLNREQFKRHNPFVPKFTRP